MRYDKEKFLKCFKYYSKILTEYKLPSWDNLPSIDLYMDQVIVLINQYLYVFNAVSNEDKSITPSMINNYVKLNIIPAPNKKKYSKVHLSYLIIICILKQTLNMATIQKIIPINISEEEVKKIYNSFVHNQLKSLSYVIEKIKEVADPIINSQEENQERLNDLTLQIATSSNIFKILTEKLVYLQLD